MTTEKALWRWLREGTKGKPCHLQRVENSLARGVLDVEGCINGVAFWLELKAGPAPARDTSLVQCEPLKDRQREFIRRRLDVGGRAWVLYRVGRDVYLIHGMSAAAIESPSVKTLQILSRCEKDATPWDIFMVIVAR